MLRRSVIFKGALACLLFAMSALTANAQSKSTWDQITETKTLRLGVAISEPWYFKDANSTEEAGGVKVGNDVWRGIGPLLAKEIADAMGVKLQIVETTWSNAVAGLQSNQFDFMFILDPTPQRALSVDFTPAPVLWYPLSLLARDGLNVQNWSDVNDPKYRIGVLSARRRISSLPASCPTRRLRASRTTVQSSQPSRPTHRCRLFDRPNGRHCTGSIENGADNIAKTDQRGRSRRCLRLKSDARWRNYLSTVVAYYYNTGKTQEL